MKEACEKGPRVRNKASLIRAASLMRPPCPYDHYHDKESLSSLLITASLIRPPYQGFHNKASFIGLPYLPYSFGVLMEAMTKKLLFEVNMS